MPDHLRRQRRDDMVRVMKEQPEAAIASASRSDIDELVDHACARFADRLGPEVPLHFTPFHPADKMMDVAPTPPSTLTRARAIGLGNGRHPASMADRHHSNRDFWPAASIAAVYCAWHAALFSRARSSSAS